MGLRGCGKSSVGRRLARRLGGSFIDLDDVTPGILGFVSVGEAWAARGEAAFRDAERQALDEALCGSARVLSLGGGTPTAPGAAELLTDAKSRGVLIVYLRASAAALAKRLAGADNAHRPSLTGAPANSPAEIELVLARRDPLYRSLADLVIEVDALSVEDVAGRLEIAAAGG